jgi:hypothetical protein
MAPATPRAPGVDVALLDQWLTSVERHDPGEVDAPLAAAAAWTSADPRNLWSDVQILLQI